MFVYSWEKRRVCFHLFHASVLIVECLDSLKGNGVKIQTDEDGVDWRQEMIWSAVE